jgi:surface antigen
MRNQALMAAAAASALAVTAAPAPALAQTGISSLFTCNTPGAQNRAGTIIGGLAGAAIGNQVAKNERTLGTIAGAAIGAMAGNYIGCRMQASSQARAEDALETALNTGRSQAWRDPRTGAHGRFDVLDARYSAGYGAAPYAGQYSSNVDFRDLRFGPGVARLAAHRIQPDAAVYIAPGRVNLRAAPVRGAAVVDRTRPGEELTVAGRTADGWLVVHEDGYVRGYVSANVLRRRGAEAYATSGYRGDCRLVRQTVNLSGYPAETQQFAACRDGSGEWRIQPA